MNRLIGISNKSNLKLCEELLLKVLLSYEENSSGLLKMLPLDTHLFTNGTASDEDNEKLIDMSERTCYLHATLCSTLNPVINVKYI